MRAGGSWVASRFVHFALAAVVPRGTASHLLVAIPSIATFQTDPLASVLSLPKHVIVLAAISEIVLSILSLLSILSFWGFLDLFGKCEWEEEYLFLIYLFIVHFRDLLFPGKFLLFCS